MQLGRFTLALAVAFGLTTAATAAPPKGTKAIPVAKKHHHLHHIHGVVVAVQQSLTTRGHGEIQVKVHHKHHKKTAKSAAAAAVAKKPHHTGIMTFHVHTTTKFAKVVLSQGKVHRHPASLGEVKKGSHVGVYFNKLHHAKHVTIIVHHHNKKVTPTITKKPPLKPKKVK
jgi:hypothetical protein